MPELDPIASVGPRTHIGWGLWAYEGSGWSCFDPKEFL